MTRHRRGGLNRGRKGAGRPEGRKGEYCAWQTVRTKGNDQNFHQGVTIRFAIGRHSRTTVTESPAPPGPSRYPSLGSNLPSTTMANSSEIEVVACYPSGRRLDDGASKARTANHWERGAQRSNFRPRDSQSHVGTGSLRARY